MTGRENDGQMAYAERFRALADSYGGDLRRWPDADRATARGYAILHPFAAWRALREARQLDGILATSRGLAVSRQLIEQISRSAPAKPKRSPSEHWLRGAWLGTGLAAACAAGVATGAALATQIESAPRAQIGADPVEAAAAALREPSELDEA